MRTEYERERERERNNNKYLNKRTNILLNSAIWISRAQVKKHPQQFVLNLAGQDCSGQITPAGGLQNGGAELALRDPCGLAVPLSSLQPISLTWRYCWGWRRHETPMLSILLPSCACGSSAPRYVAALQCHGPRCVWAFRCPYAVSSHIQEEEGTMVSKQRESPVHMSPRR